MSKHDFTPEEFADRRRRVREAMEAAGLDWLVLFHPVSIHWLTGSDAKSYQEFQCLLISTKPGPLVVLTREGERAEFQDDALVDEIWSWGGREFENPLEHFERLARTYGLIGAFVGIEVPAYYLHPHHYVALKEMFVPDFKEVTNLVPDLKLVKSPTEIAYVREASRLADGAMDVFARSLQAGKTELELAGEVYHALLTAGSGLAASPINLVSGERSGFSHGAATTRRLQPGDYGSIEYGATWKRYTATIGRQFCLGQPTPRMQELYDVVRRASDACLAAIRPGVPANVPHAAAKQIIGDARLERGRVHTTGYSLAPGFPPTWGEPLHLLAGSTYVLQQGMVITIEPPVFLDDERLGARIIDNVLVTKDGAELLSRFSREMIVVGES